MEYRTIAVYKSATSQCLDPIVILSQNFVNTATGSTWSIMLKTSITIIHSHSLDKYRTKIFVKMGNNFFLITMFEYWCYLENMRANSQRKEYPCKIQNAQFVCFILSQFRSNFVTWMT